MFRDANNVVFSGIYVGHDYIECSHACTHTHSYECATLIKFTSQIVKHWCEINIIEILKK